MNDIKTQISEFAAKEEKKVEAWFGSNFYPFGLGAAAMGIVWLVVRHF